MVTVKVTENKDNGMCEIKVTTEHSSYTFWSEKKNVTQRISDEMTELGY